MTEYPPGAEARVESVAAITPGTETAKIEEPTKPRIAPWEANIEALGATGDKKEPIETNGPDKVTNQEAK